MFDVQQSIFDSYGEMDGERIENYIDGLMTEFADSVEAQPVIERFGRLCWSATQMRYAIDYLGATPAEMTVGDFEEVVFDLFPRKVSTEPDSAESIIAELAAFWQFLHRQYGLESAPEILASLGDGGRKRLHKELADPSNYGMAKSMVMAGQAAGFDMTTQEGAEQFILLWNARLASQRRRPSTISPLNLTVLPLETLPPDDRKRRREKRKLQRQARNHGRR